MGKKSSSPPDYGPLAQASKESAEIMAQLGREQLDFAKQQYQELKPLYQDIVNRQLQIADQALQQGQEHNDYLKIFRPVERTMNYEALGLTPLEVANLEAIYASGNKDAYLAALSNASTNAVARRQAELAAIRAQDEADARIIGGQDADVYNARRNEIDYKVGQAIADAQGAYTRTINQAIRQGLRYGASPAAIAFQVGGLGLAQASQIASTANAARQAGIQQQRALAQTNMGLRRDIQANIDRQRALDWAKKLDVVGIAKGLPGASQGAYGLAINAGNSAGHNAAIPGQQYMAGMAQGINTIGQGRQLYQQGLSSILNAQAQVYAADAQKADPFSTILGIGLGGWASGGFKLF